MDMQPFQTLFFAQGSHSAEGAEGKGGQIFKELRPQGARRALFSTKLNSGFSLPYSPCRPPI